MPVWTCLIFLLCYILNRDVIWYSTLTPRLFRHDSMPLARMRRTLWYWEKIKKAEKINFTYFVLRFVFNYYTYIVLIFNFEQIVKKRREQHYLFIHAYPNYQLWALIIRYNLFLSRSLNASTYDVHAVTCLQFIIKIYVLLISEHIVSSHILFISLYIVMFC